MVDDSIVKASSTMALGTIFSRITGLVRNLMLASVLGTALLGDTYNVGNTMPNILYNILIGGALTAVFVPQIVRSLRDSDGGEGFISKLYSSVVTVLFILTLIGVLAAPLLVNIYAPEFNGRPEFNLTVAFMRYCLPQIFFLGVFMLLGQIANAKNKFGPMMWAPVLNNLIVIALLTWFLLNRRDISVGNISDAEVAWLGLGTTFGYLAQAAILLPVIRRTGIKLKFRFDWRNSGLGKSVKLAGWSFIYAAISQLSYLVTVNLATSAGVKAAESGISTGVGFTPYQNAYLIMILPHSVITVSLITALLPRLSNHVIDNQLSELKESLTSALKTVAVFTVPAALVFLSFGPLIAKNLYFDLPVNDANYLGLVLSGLSLGLIPLSINLIIMRGLNAFENVKAQAQINLIINIVAILLSVAGVMVFAPEWVTVWLGVTFPIHYLLGTFLSFRFLARHGLRIRLRPILYFYTKLMLVTGIGLLPLWLLRNQIPGGNFLQLILVLMVTSLIYILTSRLLKIDEVSDAVKLLLRSTGVRK